MSKTPQERYVEKPFLGSSHRWAISRCSDLATSATVLDVGPGSGVMGRALREKGVSSLFAIEVDPIAREHVSPLYTCVAEDLADLKDTTFDLVLLLDVLEHMPSPELFLKTVAGRVNPGGRILVSVPNIAHWSIRLALLVGFFEPMDRGPFDRTHLQCLTRRRFKSMLKGCPGTRISRLEASIVPVQHFWPERFWRLASPFSLPRLRLIAANAWPGLFAYQHLGELVKD